MKMAKERLSASVDSELISAGRRAVLDGSFGNLSSWVNEALRQRADLDEKLRGLDEYIAEYEAKYGEISQEEIADVTQRMSTRAIRVQPRRDAV